MGKIKTKYPVDFNVQFYLIELDGDYFTGSMKVTVQSGPLTYKHLKDKFEQFLTNNDIKYEAYMFLNTEDNSNEQELLRQDFTLSIDKAIEVYGDSLFIIVKSHTAYIKELIDTELGSLNFKIDQLEQLINTVQTKQDVEVPKQYYPHPLQHQPSFLSNNQAEVKELDVGILFSQPIYDEIRKREANYPVDFRSQIQRLHIALNSSYKPEIAIKCEIATRENIKHLINNQKPKILHIICHGSKEGTLEFEDDSRTVLGTLNIINKEMISEILLNLKDSLPEIVFINSCYSENVGNIFYEVGVKYVIMIDSQDKIDDEAAQIFSQNFYRNLFKGEKVGTAFKIAKDSVIVKHNSFGCCCRHSSKETHKETCRWNQVIKKTIGEREGHKLYHIPSQKCNCELRNLNKHRKDCEWAKQSLFQINNDFRITDEKGCHFPNRKDQLPKYVDVDKNNFELKICCCFNYEGETQFKNPHSQSNKFKMLPNDQEKTEALFKLEKGINNRSMIIDYTAPQLIQIHEKVHNTCVMGRQQELFLFMKSFKESIPVFILHGQSGVGKTSFAIKTATYLIERRAYDLYFFIDLYDIKDKEMFRYKFNQITKFNYANNKINLTEIKTKLIIIIFDNADEFLLTWPKEFYSEIQHLVYELSKTKFIITFKSQTFASLETDKIDCEVKHLDSLREDVAAKILFSKIKNQLDISVQYMSIHGIVSSKPELRIPKVIENISHAFNSLKNKLKLTELKNRINEIGEGDHAFNQLIEQNLKILFNKSKQTYQILIFISQFSQGVQKNDFTILSNYERGTYVVDIPIDKNWKQCFALLLFEQSNETNDQKSEITKDSENESLDSRSNFNLGKAASSIQLNQEITSNSDGEGDEIVFRKDRKQSYFLQETSKNRFVVKRFIRDFLWNKHKSDSNYYMKHLFVAYMAVMLQIYFKRLVEENYIHEELCEYNATSSMGIFSYKDNNYTAQSLTESVSYYRQYNNQFEDMLKDHPTTREKIDTSDPSTFMLNHKLDFLHIYSFDWTKVYQYLLTNKKLEVKIFISYLQHLIILIPTVLMIAEAENNLIQYSISKSLQLLSSIRQFSLPINILILTLKLKLMKASNDLQKEDVNELPSLDFHRDVHKSQLEKIPLQTLNQINQQWQYQIRYLEMYKELLAIKSIKKAPYNSSKNNLEKIKNKLEQWLQEEGEWKNIYCEILPAKRELVLAQIFYSFILVASPITYIKFKKDYMYVFMEMAQNSARTFNKYNLIKLCLKSKLIRVSLHWELIGKSQNRLILNSSSTIELEKERARIKECEAIYEDRKNNLIGFTFFDMLIKKFKKEMKEKMWQESVNSMIFMKAFPISNLNIPIIQNIVRKKGEYRIEIDKIMNKSLIDISTKYDVLTQQKLEEQTKNGCSILIISANIAIKDSKIFMIIQGNTLNEKRLEINQEFIMNFPIYKVKLCIFVGKHAQHGIRAIEKLIQNLPTKPVMPSLMSITGLEDDPEFTEFEELKEEDLVDEIQNLKDYITFNIHTRKTQILYTREFIKLIINRSSNKSLKEINYEIKRRFPECESLNIYLKEGSNPILDKKDGTYKDLTPGYRKAHNIDTDPKLINSAILKKWKQINEVMKNITENPKESSYINIFGLIGSGKSTFIEELGRLFIERHMFENGVYIISGRQVQTKFDGDFDKYIIKKSQSGNMFNMQSFNKYANQSFMLMIDDFHVVRPRANGHYEIFLKKLIQKKVNVILITHEKYNERAIFRHIRPIKLQKLTNFELSVLAFNLLDTTNSKIMSDFEILKANDQLTCRSIIQLKEKYQINNLNGLYPKKNNLEDSADLKKMVSNLN